MGLKIPSGTRISWLGQQLKKTAILLVFLFILAADLICGRIFIDPPNQIPHPYYHHDLRPANLKQRLVWQGRYYVIYTNSLGFKDAAIRKIDLETKRYRIVFLGDSLTEGVGFPYQETFVGLIGAKLKENGLEVLNAAVGGYSPRLYYLKAKYLIENVKLKFSELFIVMDATDIEEEIYYKDFVPFTSCQGLAHKLHRWLLRNSFIYNGVYYKIVPRLRLGAYIRNTFKIYGPLMRNDKAQPSPYEFGEREKDALILGAENMQKLYALCKDSGIRMTIALLPLPADIRYGTIEPPYVLFWKGFCQKNNIGFINYYPAFINAAGSSSAIDKFYLKGDCHFNASGHSFIADKTMQVLENGERRNSGPGNSIKKRVN